MAQKLLDAVPNRAVLVVRPWPDAVVDALGFDPRSAYVEHFWLSVLGPSTTWLLRRLVEGLDRSPDGFEFSVRDMARGLGLGGQGGRHGIFARSLRRAAGYELVRFDADGGLSARRKLPPLNLRQVAGLPADLQAEHRRWQEAALRTPSTVPLRPPTGPQVGDVRPAGPLSTRSDTTPAVR